MNIYLSSSSNGNSIYNLFIRPYSEGAWNFNKGIVNLISKDSRMSTSQCLKHVTIGLTLLCPIVNTIALIALRTFGKMNRLKKTIPSAPSVSSQAPSVSSKSHYFEDPKDISPVNISSAHHPKRVGYTNNMDIYDDSKRLAQEGKFKLAWKSYCTETSFHVTGLYDIYDNKTSVSDWIVLPCEELICGYIETLSTDEIKQIMTVDFVRECAIAYSGFRQNQLLEDNVLDCFLAYPEYILDICAQCPVFGKNLVLSGFKIPDLKDTQCLELFKSIYPALLDHIDEENLTDKEIKRISKFLLQYKLSIDLDTFKKIEHLEALFKHKKINFDQVVIEYKNQGVF